MSFMSYKSCDSATVVPNVSGWCRGGDGVGVCSIGQQVGASLVAQQGGLLPDLLKLELGCRELAFAVNLPVDDEHSVGWVV